MEEQRAEDASESRDYSRTISKSPRLLTAPSLTPLPLPPVLASRDVRWTIECGNGRGRVPIGDDEISSAVWRALVYARRVFYMRMEKFTIDAAFTLQCSNALERKAAAMRLHYLRLRRRALVRSVECGLRHSVILTAGGEVWTCGFEGNGQLGRGDSYYQAQFMVASEHFKNEKSRTLLNKQRDAAYQQRRLRRLKREMEEKNAF